MHITESIRKDLESIPLEDVIQRYHYVPSNIIKSIHKELEYYCLAQMMLEDPDFDDWGCGRLDQSISI